MNNIYHKSSISAAKFINKIWNNIDDWWFSNNTQNSIKNYCDNFSLPRNKGVNSLIKAIKKEI